MKKLKRIICCILLSVFVLTLLLGCSSEKELVIDEVIADGETYQVVRSGEDYYIIPYEKYTGCMDYEDYLRTDSIPGLFYTSIDRLITDILENKISLSHIQELRWYNRLENNAPLKIFDIKNVYKPVSPVEYEITEVAWFGPVYTYFVRPADGSSEHASFAVYCRESFTEGVDKYYAYLDRVVKEGFTVTETEDRNATVYRGEEEMYILYTLTTDKKTVQVTERYRIAAEGSLSVSDTVPQEVSMYVTEGDLYYSVGISEFDSRPSEEWLLSFGIERYTPEE